MNKFLLEKLKKWQSERSRRDNVEAYRVLPYSVLKEIARREPQSAEELLEIKGIKEKKLARYGKEILALVTGEKRKRNAINFDQQENIFEVSQYLDLLNSKLIGFEARVKGEISRVQFQGNSVYYAVKDKNDESVLECYMWLHDYETSGVEIEVGVEVILWGYPNIWKPTGKLSLRTKLIELVGEGALKKAYDELKRKLEEEGIFQPERKKPIPDFSHKIGLITSHQGAAIGDFISNLGNYGFQIKFYSSRVEGKQAVFDLLKAIKWFNKNMPELDALVLIRGGGSLESLQSFNTEILVREISNSKIPILAGIGHEKDISLAALAADKMVSTPTSAAVELTRSWDEAANKVNEAERNLLSYVLKIFERFEKVKITLYREAEKIGQTIFYEKEKVENFSKDISYGFLRTVENVEKRINNFEDRLKIYNPERQLELGYSLVSIKGKIVRSVKNVKLGEEANIKMSDGEMKSEIKIIIPKV